MPAWAEHDPGIFWKAADEHERANGSTYREVEVALPRELTPDQRRALVEDFVREHIGDRHPFTFAIHIPKAAIEKGEQPHAHIMYSERTLDGIARDPELFFKRANTKNPERGGCKKASGGKLQAERKAELLATRERWANVQNKHLERAGVDARVSHLSLRAQGIDRTPEIHLGPVLAKQHATALREHRAAERELALTPQVNAATKLAQREAAAQAAEINAKLTLETKEKENDRIRAAVIKSLGKASGATDRVIAFTQSDHERTSKSLGTASADIGSTIEGAERRVARSHLESSAPAVRDQLGQAHHLFQQLVEYLPRVVTTIAAAEKEVTQQLQKTAAKTQEKPPTPAKKSYYHPDRIAAREKKEKEMATKAEHDLVAAATARRAENPKYRPTQAELKAVDQVLIEQTKKKLGIPEPTIQPSNQPGEAVTPAPGPSFAEMLKASFEKMLDWIKSAGGSHKEIDTQHSEHFGAVVELDDMHCVQRTGKGIYLIHRIDELDNVPALNDPKTEIRYAGGVGVVSGKALDKDRGR